MRIVDTLDLKILSYLAEDGRVPNRELARRVGVSEGTIRQRLKRLAQEGRLRIAAQADIESVPDAFLALVGVKLDGRHLAECAEQVRKLPSVLSTMIVTGRYDLIAIVLAGSHRSLVDSITTQISHIDGVRDSETFVVLRNFDQWIPVDKVVALLRSEQETAERRITDA